MSGYNTALNGQSVRIGNWFEEQKLKEETGVRYYPSPKDRATSLLTKSRCITHTDQILPKDYTTVTKTTIIDPKTHPEYGNARTKLGPRQQRLENTLKQMVDEEVERKTTAEFKESRKFAYGTLTHESFSKDNFTPTLKLNDRTVRHPTKNTNYSTDTAVTFYSHALNDPTARVAFPTTFVGSINPFRKNGFFSADIEKHTLARRTETYERPKPLPTVLEFKTLTNLRSRLLNRAGQVLKETYGFIEPGAKVRVVLNTLLGPDSDFLSPDEVEDILRKEMGDFVLTEADRDALLSAYDMNNNRRISIGDMCLFIKRTPAPRRLELIHYVFDMLDSRQEGIVSCEALKELMRKNGSPHLKFCYEYMESINPDVHEFNNEDFFDYCTDISSEIEDDDQFERFMKGAFEF